MTEILYHYTSLDSFLKIAQSKLIRLSDLSQSNDALEGRFILEHLVEGLRTSSLPPEYLSLFEQQLEEMIDYERAFGFCLSQGRDDLSQWRGYGSDGYGICIGFDRFALEQAVRDTNKTTKNAKLEKINYGKEGVEPVVGNLTEAIDNIDWASWPKENFEHSFFKYWVFEDPKGKELVKASGQAFVALHNSISDCFESKSQAFQSEREWRILVPGNSIDGDEVGYHTSMNRIIAFLSSSIKNSISEVVIGPKCLVTRKDMHRVLGRLKLRNSKGQIPVISVSSASYR